MDDKIYTDLLYIDSLDDDESKAEALLKWTEIYLDNEETRFELPIYKLEALDELFYKNIAFLNEYLDTLKISMGEIDSLKKFHQH